MKRRSPISAKLCVDLSLAAQDAVTPDLSPAFVALATGEGPGSRLDARGISVSTLRRWEQHAWIRRDWGETSWSHVYLTRIGFTEIHFHELIEDSILTARAKRIGAGA